MKKTLQQRYKMYKISKAIMKRVEKSTQKSGDEQFSADLPESYGSMVNNGFMPLSSSAPPLYSETIYKSSWDINLKLELLSGRKITNPQELFNSMTVIVDYYEGHVQLRNAIIGMYMLSGLNLGWGDIKGGMYTYGTRFQNVVTFCHRDPRLHEHRTELRWKKTIGFDEDKIIIDFKITMMPSKRIGPSFMTLLKGEKQKAVFLKSCEMFQLFLDTSEQGELIF